MLLISKKAYTVAAAALVLAACATSSFAETLKGRVDVANQSNKTLVVAGITFQTDAQTAFNDKLASFNGLKQGQKVSVEFERSGTNVYTARKITLEE